MSGPPICRYHSWSKSLCVPAKTTSRTIGNEATSSGSAALITSELTAVLKNCATKTFSATFFWSSMKLAGRSKLETALMIALSAEFTIVTLATATSISPVSNKPGARKNASHCSRTEAISLSVNESITRSPRRCPPFEPESSSLAQVAYCKPAQ